MPSTSLSIRPALRTWIVCGVLLAGTVWIFSRAADYGFSNYDDPRYITENARVQAGLTRESIVWAFTGQTDYWHPLTWMSHMLDWEIHGPSAAGHRFTSTLWHALNAVLAFLFFRRLTGAFWTSAISAALFAWHPLRVESVVWIAERKDVMSGCFLLLTLWAYLAYAERRVRGEPAATRYALALIAFAGGLMSKPVFVTAPLVLLALDFWPLGRWRDLRTARVLVLEKIPFFALSAIISVATILMQRKVGAFTLDLPFAARVGNAIVSPVRYLGKYFWPADLTPFYPHPGHWPAWIVAAAAAFLVALATLAWRQRRLRPWLLTGGIWFLAFLLPVIGLLQVGFQAMADRYLYLPTLGLQLALLWTAREFAPRGRAAALVAPLATMLLIACALRTWQQQGTWRDPVTLLQHALDVTDRNSVAEGFLGYTFAGLGRHEEAERHCRRALELDPRNESALYALAEIRTQQGRIPEAIDHLREILRFNPGEPETEYKLGRLLLRQGDSAAALPHLQAAVAREPRYLQSNLQGAAMALRQGESREALGRYQFALLVDPDNADAHFGCALAFAQLDQLDAALPHYETAARLRPRHLAARVAAGLIHLNRRRPAEAAAHFRAVIEAEPSAAAAHLGLGRAAEQLGRAAEADASFARALALAPTNPQVHRAWADILARRGKFTDALPHYRRAVELQPDDAEAHAGLGFALFLSGRREEAISAWEEALRLKPDFPGLRERLERSRGR